LTKSTKQSEARLAPKRSKLVLEEQVKFFFGVFRSKKMMKIDMRIPNTGGPSPVHPDTPTLTRHLLATLSSRSDVNGGELFRCDRAQL
jgi:hypothetical protein